MTDYLPATQKPDLLRVEQVAAELGLSVPSIYSKIRSGQIRSLSLITGGKSRGRRLIPRAAVDEFIANSVR